MLWFQLEKLILIFEFASTALKNAMVLAVKTKAFLFPEPAFVCQYFRV